MIPEEVQPSDAISPTETEFRQPKEDPDKIRGEVFKRMFPDVPPKAV
jgi:hypothetical protein